MKIPFFSALLSLLMGALSGCGNGGPILFSLQDDKDLGRQLADRYRQDSSFPILARTQHSFAYQYLEGIMEEILTSGEVQYQEEFAWELFIIGEDQTLNAFVTPGGYIYVYTGLIKYLDRVDDLAGVLGHEIAHADRRHTSRQLQLQHGIELLLSLLTGDETTALTEIAGSVAGRLGTLKFSRSLESEADRYSVKYLQDTRYACQGAASFFEKLQEEQEGQSGTPRFLSSHPSGDNRIEEINSVADQLGCDKSFLTNAGYEQLKNSLP